MGSAPRRRSTLAPATAPGTRRAAAYMAAYDASESFGPVRNPEHRARVGPSVGPGLERGPALPGARTACKWRCQRSGAQRAKCNLLTKRLARALTCFAPATDSIFAPRQQAP